MRCLIRPCSQGSMENLSSAGFNRVPVQEALANEVSLRVSRFVLSHELSFVVRFLICLVCPQFRGAVHIVSLLCVRYSAGDPSVSVGVLLQALSSGFIEVPRADKDSPIFSMRRVDMGNVDLLRYCTSSRAPPCSDHD